MTWDSSHMISSWPASRAEVIFFRCSSPSAGSSITWGGSPVAIREMVVTSRPLPEPAVEASNTNSGARAKNMRPVRVSGTAMALALSAGAGEREVAEPFLGQQLDRLGDVLLARARADRRDLEAAGVQDEPGAGW